MSNNTVLQTIYKTIYKLYTNNGIHSIHNIHSIGSQPSIHGAMPSTEDSKDPSVLLSSYFIRYLEKLSLIRSNDTPIDGTNVLHIVEGRDEQENNCQYSEEQNGNDCDNNGRVADLVSCTCGDHVSAVRALKVGQWLLSKGGW